MTNIVGVPSLDDLYDAVENYPELLLSSVHHASILFLATYLAHSFGIGNFIGSPCPALRLRRSRMDFIHHRYVRKGAEAGSEIPQTHASSGI